MKEIIIKDDILQHAAEEGMDAFVDVFTNFWEVTDFQRSAEFFNDFFEIYFVKSQPVSIEVKSLLREIRGLLDKVNISVFHL